jgi:hypothetical protein|tara:strand:+ start:1521 stop:2213 length:693 start_codon:yes stop_codon:yes gene_type:complete
MNFYKGLITTLATCLLIIGCGKTSDPSGIVDLVEDEEVVEDTEIVEDEVIEEEEVEEEEEEEEVEEEDPAITYEDCSGRVGDHPCNFEFLDQNGDTWNLWDHTGTVMVIDFSTMWCGVCKSIAGDTQAHQDTYTDLGFDFLWVTVLVDDTSWGNPPDQQDVQDWVDAYGITTAPVLAGDRSLIDTTAASGIPIVSWPTFIIVDQDMRITYGLGGWSESMITNELEIVLGL